MLAMLVNKFPEVMGIIKRKLMIYVAEAERRYNYSAGSFWYRFMRPNDPELGGTDKVYTATFSNTAEENILATAATITVPVSNAYVSFGWYNDADYGVGGYLRVTKQGVEKSLIHARVPYQSKNPKYLYIDFDSVIVGWQQEILDFIAYNEFGADQINMCFPFMFRIASKSALNLE
ncbi:hypothetical protein LCGC14_2284710 [marine sediment metagenome]|uniref:Uncharacterized protein n=1 Tax=marine sediment metagenome TaxID=412755 RepID=A0A0F9F5J5_9ZZZZ